MEMTEYYVDDEDNTSEDGNYIVESNAPEVLKGIFYFLKEYEIHFKNDRNGYHGWFATQFTFRNYLKKGFWVTI